MATAAAAKRISLETDVMLPKANVLADRKHIVQVPSNMLDTR